MKIDGITIANQEKGMALHRFRLHPTVNSKHISHNYILHLIKVRRWHRFGFSDWLSYKVINWAAQHGWAKNKNKLNPNRCHYLLITYLTFDVGFTIMYREISRLPHRFYTWFLRADLLLEPQYVLILDIRIWIL